VTSVRKISGRRIALVLDQWEETRDLEPQRNAFRNVLREPEQWSGCHILLGARESSAGAELLQELEREFPGAAHVHMLGEMDLATQTERQRLVAFLHAQPQLRAIENVDDNRVLNLVGGYPRVISRWVAEDARERVRAFHGLEGLAREANEFRYSDLEKLLLGLDGDKRRLAVRSALVPLAEDAEAWRALRPVILADLDRSALDDLKIDNILDKAPGPPRFGHPTRRDAARVFLETRRSEAVGVEVEALIVGLARSVTVIGASAVPYLTALVGLQDAARQQKLAPTFLALCDAASSLLGTRLTWPACLIEGAQQAGRSSAPGLGLVLAAALYNTLNYAEADGDRTRRDNLLAALRQIAGAHPNDAAVRQALAMGLFNTLSYAKAEGALRSRDSLLEELRVLAGDYPDDSIVREQLAGGLCAAVSYAEPGDDLVRRDRLLKELRKLARDHPNDLAVRESLAKGLNNTLVDARADGELGWSDALLDELRTLARDYPNDTAVSQCLAAGLCWALVSAKTEDIAAEDKLRELLNELDDDALFRARLAQRLNPTPTNGKKEGDPSRRGLLEELRALARVYPGDAAVRKWLTLGLSYARSLAEAEGELEQGDALLGELKALAMAFPDDPAVREVIARLERA
jgi:hypothetical protein